MNRREFVVSAGATSAIGVLGGCLGSSSGGNSSENGSGNSSTGNSSGNESTVNPDNVVKRVTFEGGEMFVHVGENVRRVRLYDPNGQKYGATKIGKSETSAKFTLVKVESGSVVEGYSSGKWKARADRKTDSGYQEIAWRNLNFRKEIEPTKLRIAGSSSDGDQQTLLTVKNTGSAPIGINGVRLSAKGHTPTGGTFSKVENPVLPPDSTAEAGVSFLGYTDQFELKEGETPSDVGDKYCNGETVPATIEISGANDDVTTFTKQVSLQGEPVQSTVESEYRCSAVSLQSNSSTNSSSNSSTNSS